MQRGFQGDGTVESHRLPLSLLETLNDNRFILYKSIICPISVADLKIVFLSVIFKIFFPAKGEALGAPPG